MQSALSSDITNTLISFTLKTTANIALEICIKDKILDEVNALNF
jgi:hypothetical protein